MTGSYINIIEGTDTEITDSLLILKTHIITIGSMVFEPSPKVIVSNMAPHDKKGRYRRIFGLTRAIGWSMAPRIGVFRSSGIAETVGCWGRLSAC